MSHYTTDALFVFLAILLIIINGFFVAAEFALVKVRASRINDLVAEGRLFAKSAQWLMQRSDAALSVCQLGITAASLGLGWIGEPALARLVEPMLAAVGVTSPAVVHTAGFIIGFSIITAGHIVIGEQVPKIYGIKRPEVVFLWCAVPLKLFYFCSYPFMIVLNRSANAILRCIGIHESGHHEGVHSEEEIRAMLLQAQERGEISANEHKLLNAVFEFDEEICRRVMTPARDVEFIDIELPIASAIDFVRKSTHTRFPLCRRTLDKIIGIVHVKDFIGKTELDLNELEELARRPEVIQETAPIRNALKLFQETQQHMALVLDEHGGTVGIITFENVIEKIFGSIQDEFDDERPSIIDQGDNQYLVSGNVQLSELNQEIGTELSSKKVDTLSGYLTDHIGRILEESDEIELPGVTARITSVKRRRADQVQLRIEPAPTSPDEE